MTQAHILLLPIQKPAERSGDGRGGCNRDAQVRQERESACGHLDARAIRLLGLFFWSLRRDYVFVVDGYFRGGRDATTSPLTTGCRVVGYSPEIQDTGPGGAVRLVLGGSQDYY